MPSGVAVQEVVTTMQAQGQCFENAFFRPAKTVIKWAGVKIQLLSAE